MKSNECMLSIEGLDCPNCAAKVERKINTLEGIKEANVDFLGKKIVVLADEISENELVELIQTEVDKIEDGVKVFVPKVQAGESSSEEEDTGKIKKKLLIGGILFVLGIFVPKTLFIPKLAVFLVSYLVIGGDVLLSAFKNILNGQVFDENFLMAIATIGAFAIGEYPEGVAVMLFTHPKELFPRFYHNNFSNFYFFRRNFFYSFSNFNIGIIRSYVHKRNNGLSGIINRNPLKQLAKLVK